MAGKPEMRVDPPRFSVFLTPFSLFLFGRGTPIALTDNGMTVRWTDTEKTLSPCWLCFVWKNHTLWYHGVCNPAWQLDERGWLCWLETWLRPSYYSLSYIKRGKTRNYLYPIWSPYAYYLYCYKYRITLREKMLPCYKSAPESLVGPQMGRSTEQGDHDQLKELYSAGNLTVLATDLLPHQDPMQLDFHFRLSPQTSAHWHGLLCDHRLFLDIPYRALDQGNQESLTATLEYVEEKTTVDSVFVNFQNNRNDRGALLRAFSYMGFELVRPGHPALPPWDNAIFMVYPLERDLDHLPCEPP